MKLLKITTQGLINITNTEVISYNRAAILKEGWKLRRAGVKDGDRKSTRLNSSHIL